MIKNKLRIGMVGYEFMGRVHSQAWRTAPKIFNLPLEIEMTTLCGRSEKNVKTAAKQLGWNNYEADYKKMIASENIDLIDICVPGFAHKDIAIETLNAGKHVMCEKPLANSLEEATQMANTSKKALKESGAISFCGFTNRRIPAVQLAKQYIEQGRLGTINQVRGQYLQDWLVDPQVPLSWRLQKDKAGSGSLGDLGAHIVDLAYFLTDNEICEVSGMLKTFTKQRPLPSGVSGIAGIASKTNKKGAVTVDDSAWFTVKFKNGAFGSFEATRMSTGHKNALTIEISGSNGAIYFDLEELNVLWFCDRTDSDFGFKKIMVTEPHMPYYSAWWPSGHIIGWEHGFTHQIVDVVNAIANNKQPEPSFTTALATQKVLDAVEKSNDKNSAWVKC